MVPWVLWVLSALGRSVLNRRRPPVQTQKADLAVRRDHNALCAADLDHLPVHARPCRLDETTQQVYSQPAAGRAGLHPICCMLRCTLQQTRQPARPTVTADRSCCERSQPRRNKPKPLRARVRANMRRPTTLMRAANAHVHCRMRCGKHSTARTSTLVAEPSSSGVGPPMRARAVAPVALQSLHVATRTLKHARCNTCNTHQVACNTQHRNRQDKRGSKPCRQCPSLMERQAMRAVTCCAQHTTRNAQHARCSTVWHTGGCRTWTAVAQPSAPHAL